LITQTLRSVGLKILGPDFRVEKPLVRLLALWLAMKFAILLVGMLGQQLLPFNEYSYGANLLLDVQRLPGWMRLFNTWDTQHYVFLSLNGYGVNPMSNAFYPLYPFLIRLATPLAGGHPLVAAWVIANLVSLFVPVLMYQVCRHFQDRDMAFRSSVLLLAFPTAFYLHVAYTEAVFLALCLAAFHYLFARDALRASLVCFLLPLTRAQALLLIVPVAVMAVDAVVARWHEGWRDAVGSAVRTYMPPAAATVAGVMAYFGVSLATMGDPMAGLKAQDLFVANNSIGNLLQPVAWFTRNFVDIQLQFHSYTESILDRSAFLLAIPLLVGVVRTQHRALAAYALITALVPALSGNFMSYTRFLLVVFPLFMFLGGSRRPTQYLIPAMFAVQVLLYLMHTGGYWVA